MASIAQSFFAFLIRSTEVPSPARNANENCIIYRRRVILLYKELAHRDENMKIYVIAILLLFSASNSLKSMFKGAKDESKRSSQEFKRKLSISIPQPSDDSAEESPGTGNRSHKSTGSMRSPGSPLSGSPLRSPAGSPVRSESPLRKLFTPRHSPKQNKADEQKNKSANPSNLPTRKNEKTEQKEGRPKPRSLTQEETDAYFPDDFWK